MIPSYAASTRRCRGHTASKQLLTYVSGVGPKLARASFTGAIRTVLPLPEAIASPGLGAKTFEQCAGFLRIRNAENPLDASAVHPRATPSSTEWRTWAVRADLITQPEVSRNDRPGQIRHRDGGPADLMDIKAELSKPGRRPAKAVRAFSSPKAFTRSPTCSRAWNCRHRETITAFGAFVDIGVHQDGLVHISELAPLRPGPADVVKVHEHVTVRGSRSMCPQADRPEHEKGASPRAPRRTSSGERQRPQGRRRFEPSQKG